MRTKIMGVLNVTPDSFSDGGRYFDHVAAVNRGHELIAAGADLIDVGGESTRPGAHAVDVDEELRRIIPVVTQLAADGVEISVDTRNVRTAAAAAQAGARILNDVSGGTNSPEMLTLAASTGLDLVLMHWRTHLASGAGDSYADVVGEVRRELRDRVDAALQAGVAAQQIIVDPGLGFAKNAQHNWQLLAGIDSFATMGHRLLVAASRKRFLAELINPSDPACSSEPDRDAATAAVTAVSARAGAWAVRVHDARVSRIAAEVVSTIDSVSLHDASAGQEPEAQ